ncbi:MAG TPA: hypothetical protein VKO43_05530 [Candidatus Krumholzibacteriaceae bacterium]|nr:hypothetical protein [Candidatus Krumholzibacteriaceae bacterium]
MSSSHRDEKVLKKTKNYVKFHRLLTRAENNGRLGGKFRCPVCGMRYLSAEKANNCCRIDLD